MPRQSSRRESRGKGANYRPQDAYSFLDSEDEATAQAVHTGRKKRRSDDDDDTDAADTFTPDAAEPEDEEQEFEVEDEQDEDEDDEMIDVEDDEDESFDKRRSKHYTPKITSKPIRTAAAAHLTPTPRTTTPRPKSTAKPRATPRRPVIAASDRMRNRGVDHEGRGTRGGGLDQRVMDLFGPSEEDLQGVKKTREYWFLQETLPLRGLLHRSFYIDEESREKEAQGAKEWWRSEGKGLFERGQRCRGLGVKEGMRYLRTEEKGGLNVLMGPLKKQVMYELRKGGFVSTAAAFEDKTDRRGWLLNLGARVQDAQWALNQGQTQYLAVPVEQKEPGIKYKPLHNPNAPAFTPTSGFPGSIQLWSFGSTAKGELDTTVSPRLEVVICASWGTPKALRWCPVSVDEANETDDGRRVHLGLLATIWSDGHVRILEVSFPTPSPDAPQTQYIHYTSTAFDIPIPHALPTCIHWLSPTSLAVATASGTLAIWTLTHKDTFPSAPNTTPQPWFYKQIADTYILTLSSGYPSRPTYISFTTADGLSTLLDLRSPTIDTAFTARGRVFAQTLNWHDHTQSFVQPDEVMLFRNNMIRRFYSNLLHLRTEAQILASATSELHPGVLVGCSDGRVWCANPVPRVLNYKEVPWRQCWFAAEWRPGLKPEGEKKTRDPDSATDSSSPESDSDFHDINAPPTDTPRRITQPTPDILTNPAVRMLEGFKVERMPLQPVKTETPYQKDVKPLTLYEEPSRVTCLAWNPNLRAGTWAVAGLGSGLLRVEDLGV
ncbi:hypothetical protein M011DRAFT_476687 [Sporormia fimetaria CBS 119925]|uniref:WD40 repeat-like protein n=1 Tax=Sporormia fimetaria CBS 119925 TaxID=1340428 RepID=A0A6A6VDZ2_9PLEO|nr:hypothetical protein M011DRAFT_476687 [Sporormia fimetaria CBS 119925]